MFRRIVGLVFVLVGLTGILLCYLGATAGRDLVDDIGRGADGFVETANVSLNTVEEGLEQSRQAISSISETISAVRTTAVNLASTAEDTQPMLDELALLVGRDIPNTISDVQGAIPNIAQTAKVVDDTLRLLSRLQVRETVPLINYEINFGLGVEYDPEVPFDQAIQEVALGLSPIADASDNLEDELQTSKANMAMFSGDLAGLAADLDLLNEYVSEFRPLLDEYGTLVDDMRAGLAASSRRLDVQLSAAKQTITIAAVWIALSQLLPLYVGIELLMGKRMVSPAELPAYSSNAGEMTASSLSVEGRAEEPDDKTDTFAPDDPDLP